MATFLSKIRTFTLGTAHDLLDKAIDMNQPVMVKQYARDLETALGTLKNEAAVAAGQLVTLQRERDTTQKQIDTNKALVAKMLAATPSPDALARGKATLILTLQQHLEATDKSIATQRQASLDMDNAVAKLEGKFKEVVARVRDLERMDRETKGKEHAHEAMTAVGKLIDAGADISIDDVAGKMQERSDVANVKFQRSMDNLNLDEDPDQASKVDDLLASLTPGKAATAQK